MLAQAEQPRVFLVSVPYAMKAGDAATVGGLPPSAFVLAAPSGGNAGASAPSGSGSNSSGNPAIGGSGTQDFIPLWIDSNGDLGNSVLFQSGTGNSAEVGINTTTPAATLDVNGGVISRGALQLPSTGTANASQGYNSQPFDLQGSAYTGSKVIGPLFQLQTEPSGNNTGTAAGTLNLLYSNGSGQPSETGLNIASNGIISFVMTQTFPNTLTGITAGTGINVTGSKTNPTVGINVTFANQYFANLNNANTFTKSQTVNGTMTATNFSGNGSGLTNVNASQLGGLSSSAFAQLAQPNIFTANQTVNGSVSATSFNGSGSGLTNVNAAELGGLPPSGYQPAGSYATTGANNFTGNQSVTGNVSATGSVTGNTATFTGLLTVNGALLPASGTASPSQGYNSQPLDAVTSVYNSGAGQAQNQDFRWQTEPVGNNSSSPSGKLNLLFGANGANPGETGISIASNGQITFASGQTFPGTGSGTVTSVGSGTGLTGGPITQSGTLQIDQTVVPTLQASTNTFSGNIVANSFSGSGTGLTNVNAAELGGLPAGSFATLGANTFTGTETVNGNIALPNTTSDGTQGVISVGGVPFIHNYGTTGSYNAFFGFEAGNLSNSGSGLTGVGDYALISNTTGSSNVASGYRALNSNTTGSNNLASGFNTLPANTTGNGNTASGFDALLRNTTGNSNTASGFVAGVAADGSSITGSNNSFFGSLSAPSTGNLNNATAIGASAEVAESNALVLGSINGVNGATANTNVGIGTTAPAYTLDVHGTGNFTGLINFASGQTFPGTGTITGVTAGTGLSGGGNSGNVTLSLTSETCYTGTALTAFPFTCSSFATLGANSFTASQSVSGNVTATGTIAGATLNATSGFDLEGTLFAFGSQSTGNAFLGFAGNTTMTGGGNTASGVGALIQNSTGAQNTALGNDALAGNSTGYGNTAVGGAVLFGALTLNTTGTYNTGIGAMAGFTQDFSPMTGSNNAFLGALTSVSTGTLTNATAIGTYSEVGASNALVLGSIKGVNGATSGVNVGIGTTIPAGPLHVNGPYGAPASGQASGNNGLLLGTNGDLSYKWIQSYGGPLALNPEGNQVGIGTNAPDATLSVNGGADKPGGGSWGTFSDRRLKNLDGSFSSGLDQIMKINPIRYRYKDDNAMGIHDPEEHVGVVAQEVQKAIPEAVTENSKGFLLVNNDPIIWAMLNAIKEQQKQIATQQEQIAVQQKLIRKQQLLARVQQRAISRQQRLTATQQREIARLSRKVGVLESSLRVGHRERPPVLLSRMKTDGAMLP
jgi:trimeric autotransporter adhesin